MLKDSHLPARKNSILGLVPLFRELENRGYDPEEVLGQQGLSLESLTGAAHISHELELSIIAKALELIDDPLLGMKVGSQVSFTAYGTYAMLLMTAPNLLEATRAGVQFQSLSLLFTQMSVHQEGDFLELRYTLPETHTNELKQFIADRDLIGTYGFLREVLDIAGLHALRAGTARVAPQDLDSYHQFIQTPIKFEQPYNWFRIPRHLLLQKQKHGNQWAYKLYRAQAFELLRKFYPNDGDIVARIRLVIEGYHTRLPTAANVAATLGMSERTLRRKLDESEVSFRQLIETHQKQRALTLLESGIHSVNQLSESLGYAEPASFLRAFKRWTGTTPRLYEIERKRSLEN